jgi:hypothetical protein
MWTSVILIAGNLASSLLLGSHDKDRVVAFIGLEGVNVVFSQVSLILIATFFF